MENIVIYVGKVVGILTVTVIVTVLITGDTVREMMWEAISTASNDNWNTYTLNNGQDREDAYALFLSEADGESYSATGD